MHEALRCHAQDQVFCSEPWALSCPPSPPALSLLPLLEHVWIALLFPFLTDLLWETFPKFTYSELHSSPFMPLLNCLKALESLDVLLVLVSFSHFFFWLTLENWFFFQTEKMKMWLKWWEIIRIPLLLSTFSLRILSTELHGSMLHAKAAELQRNCPSS